MIGNKMVEKDERTTFIENVSYKLGYKFISFLLLFDCMCRWRKFNEEPWDLFTIIIISSLVMTVYQYKQKILAKSWLKSFILTLVITFICIFLLLFS